MRSLTAGLRAQVIIQARAASTSNCAARGCLAFIYPSDAGLAPCRASVWGQPQLALLGLSSFAGGLAAAPWLQHRSASRCVRPGRPGRGPAGPADPRS